MLLVQCEHLSVVLIFIFYFQFLITIETFFEVENMLVCGQNYRIEKNIPIYLIQRIQRVIK